MDCSTTLTMPALRQTLCGLDCMVPSQMGGRCIIGKKVKKALNPVAKVFTLGATDLSGKGWGTGIVDSVAGTDYNGLKAAASDAEKQQRQVQEALIAQQANANADLSMTNVADTEVGGTANAMANTNTNKRKRAGVGGVASSLGINA
ncbi:putative virion structural protein [Pseudomonas phage phiB1_1]|uniref:Putative virion structural protein n=1 Tax=Pseudomonas phage phiB1_1 TaxID=2755402 RepID=A0A7D7F3W7_9CAUD|nr:putative virion structural protein [Pseudomonas phage phiB1_1]UAW53673.1 hypothetical protein pphageB21_40 [Pseudomonas phage pphageB21]UAW53851.1 hypothetical protein pphageBV72_39 [Pseudomonas phage pphageBV72]